MIYGSLFHVEQWQASPVPKRRDQLSEGLRIEIVRLMAHHGQMSQIELARRATEAQQRVHKFVKGDMPYPPLDFLDGLFRVFGVTVLDGLRGSVQPVTQLPILRPDVQGVADDCAGMEAEAVEAVQKFVTTLRIALRGTAPGAVPRALQDRTRAPNGSRGTRKRKA